MPPVTMVQHAHPDSEWIETVRVALDLWQGSPASSPTSSVLGGGAIAAVEAVFSEMHGGRAALLLPAATYALRIGLQALGVQPRDEVICAAVDWPTAFAAIKSLGAEPVPVAVDPATLTIDPCAAAQANTHATRAIIACHLHGVCADIPALRRLLPNIRILEDAAQAFGSRLDGHLVGTLGDAAVLSLGPGKQIDAGEGGVLLTANASLHEQAVTAACHPLRQLLAGITHLSKGALTIRPHPMTAILALHRLANWSLSSAQAAHAQALQLLAASPHVHPLEDPVRHSSALPFVPVLIAPKATPPAGVRWAPSGAQILPGLTPQDRERASGLLAQVRLASAA